MKILGACMILAGCLWIGIGECKAKKQRVLALRELCYAFEIMSAEMETNCASIPVVLTILAERSGTNVRPFFQALHTACDRLGEEPFAQLWQVILLDKLQMLSAWDMQILTRLGTSLGRYELSQQLSILRNAYRELKAQSEYASKLYPGQKKLFLALSLSLGIVAVILIL